MKEIQSWIWSSMGWATMKAAENSFTGSNSNWKLLPTLWAIIAFDFSVQKKKYGNSEEYVDCDGVKRWYYIFVNAFAFARWRDISTWKCEFIAYVIVLCTFVATQTTSNWMYFNLNPHMGCRRHNETKQRTNGDALSTHCVRSHCVRVSLCVFHTGRWIDEDIWSVNA